MRPVTFSCEAVLVATPESIAARILDLDRWPEFTGYGPLPGIRSATFETRTEPVVGTRIRVTNRDGSTHVEEIVEWDPMRRIRFVMRSFSPPLSRLAARFEETWEFSSHDGRTRVVRSFDLHPRPRLTRPVLWIISKLLRRAVVRHLRQIAAEPPART